MVAPAPSAGRISGPRRASPHPTPRAAAFHADAGCGYAPAREARRGHRPQRRRRGPRGRAPRARLPGDPSPFVGWVPQAVQRHRHARRRGRRGGRGPGHRARELPQPDPDREPDAADHGARRVLHALSPRGRGGRGDRLRRASGAVRAAVINGLLRKLFLLLARSTWLGERLPKLPFMQRAIRRLMPGNEIADALNAAVDLQVLGIRTLYTKLGEAITDPAGAQAVHDHYLELLARIKDAEVDGEISVKPTQLGLDIDEVVCLGHLKSLAAAA